MPDLKSLENVYLILAFIVPGLIVVYVRSQFTTGRIPSHTEAALSYFTISVIYYALALPLVDYVLTIRQPGYGKLLAWIGLVLVGPAFVGFLLGINAQKGITRRLLQSLNLRPVHVIPTAWDWAFGDMPARWALVTLKNGTRFAGFCGEKSFISSDPKERDLYIERIYDLGDDGEWIDRGEKSVLITGGEISTVEFWPYEENNANE